MQEVELQRLAGNMLDSYERGYQEKYGVMPVITAPAIVMGTFKDLIRRMGHHKVELLLTRYLATDGENGWYKKRGHNIQTFVTSIDALNASLGQKPPEAKHSALYHPNGRGVKMDIFLSCDVCEKHYHWIGYGDELEAPRICQTCKSSYEMVVINATEQNIEADAGFVKLCVDLLRSKLHGKITLEEFMGECDRLDAVVKELNSGCDDVKQLEPPPKSVQKEMTNISRRYNQEAASMLKRAIENGE